MKPETLFGGSEKRRAQAGGREGRGDGEPSARRLDGRRRGVSVSNDIDAKIMGRHSARGL